MSSKRPSARSRVTRDQRSLLEALDAPEAKRLLGALLDKRPELLADVAALADAKLGAVTVEDVAEDVAFALGELGVEDVWEHSGAQSDGSYVEPSEAASTVVEEALSPFVEDLARRIGLGREGEALAVCQGTLLGLYRVAQAASEGEAGFLDGYGPDCIRDTAGFVIETWKRGGTRAGSGSARRVRDWAAMHQFASEALPEWRSFLTRMLGRAPTRRERP